MEIFMIGIDVLVLMVMAAMLNYSYAFIKISLKNKNIDTMDGISQMHFQDHAIAVIFSLIGSLVGTVMAIWHIIQQHIMLVDTYWSEIGLAVGFIFLAISGLMFMRHMICEETPGHPYYIQEHTTKKD